MSTIKNGKAAEQLVISKLLMLGYNIYTPVTDDSKVDLIYEKDNKYIRVQVKVIGAYGMAVRKIGCNSKTNVKITRYTSQEVDEFIGVDLESSEAYIIPIADIEQIKGSIRLSSIQKKYTRVPIGEVKALQKPH